MQTTVPSRVLTGVVLPRSAAVSATLVVGFALLTALAAQIAIPLPFTPVPISGQTFAVLLSGAALGSTLGATSMLVYLLLGAIGLPFYAEASSGWSVLAGPTGGYIVGFIVAAWLVGRFAERMQDRVVRTAIPVFLLGSAIIHLFGVPWLANVLDVGLGEAARLGTTPFIPGDLFKIAVAGLLLPATWRLVGSLDRT